MKHAKLFAFAFNALAACAQNPSGSVDGVPIPSKAFGNCMLLRHYIEYAPRAKAIQEFDITVTPEEEAAARSAKASEWASQFSQMPGGQQGALRMAMDYRDLLPSALAEVYEQHKDPDRVYADKLAGSSISKRDWQGQVNNNANAKTIEGRAKIKQQYQNVYEGYMNTSAPEHFDAKLTVENQKLDAELDRRLGANDPTYAQYARDFKAVERHDGKGFSFPSDKKQYLDQKRAQFWAARKAKNITLSDPSLKAKCNLGVQ